MKLRPVEFLFVALIILNGVLAVSALRSEDASGVAVFVGLTVLWALVLAGSLRKRR